MRLRLLHTRIDFRSDTVTQPTKEMLHKMMLATTGDDVFQQDLSTNMLQSKIADLCGKESALLFPSGTMSNQVAIQTHLIQPPYSILCDKDSHINCWEAGGVSFHTGASVIAVKPSGLYLTLEDVEKEMIMTNDVYY
jgi:threonine aldolase